MTKPITAYDKGRREQFASGSGAGRMRSLGCRLCLAATAVWLVALITVACLLQYFSPQNWLIAVFSYLPKSPLAIPAVLLFVWALVVRSRLAVGANLVSIGLVAGPIMGLSLGGVFSSRERDDNSIQVLTANIQLGQGRIYSLLREIRRMKPDVILLQEVSPDVVPILNKGLAEWTGEISGGHWIGARGTVTILGAFDAPSTRRRAAAVARVQCDQGSLVVASIHLTTARWGLEGLSWKSPFTLEGVKAFEDHERLRTAESRETREWLNSLIGDQPSIVGGDFNSPPHVPQFRRVWGAFQDAFVSGGVGYGYTARCDHPPYWLENTPWIRIDYLLYTHHFRCPSAWTGHTDGSDHRIVAARFLRIQ